jgi:hypothetical protein
VFRGELCLTGADHRAAYLYAVGPEAHDHDAAVRIEGEAPDSGPILPKGLSTML